MPDTVSQVVVVGGGLAGLTTAYDLARRGVKVTVLEADGRWGGKIFSSAVGDRLIDAGPDNFLARVPDATELCIELGLEDRLTVPVSPKPAYLFVDGQLGELPRGTVLGVPTDFDALTGIISAEGIERAQQDMVLPPTPLSTDTTVAEYCRARLGDEVTDTLIDPMIGGINASSIEQLSMADGAHQLFDAARRNPSLVAGLRDARSEVGATLGSAAANQPVFHGLEGGMTVLVESLVERLGELGADLRLNNPVRALPTEFDHVVIATPAHIATKLLSGSRASELLGRIEHASVAQITIEIPAGRIEPLDASGILVPRPAGFVMTACTWFSTKWAQYSAEDRYVVRITSGRFGDTRAMEMTDAELTETLLAEFAQVYADPGEPSFVRVVRWHDAFPQYQPGHSALVDEIFDSVGPRTSVVGNAYRGIGIPATIRLARQTAASILN